MASIRDLSGEKYMFTLQNTFTVSKTVALLAAFFETLKLTSTYVDGTHADTQLVTFTNPAEIVAAGYSCDAVIDNGDADGVILGTTGTGLICRPIDSSKSIRAFRQYIKLNAKSIKEITIQTTVLAAFNQSMTIVNPSPLAGAAPISLPLVAYRDGMSNLNDVVSIKGSGLALGFDSLILLPVTGATTLTITFWF